MSVLTVTVTDPVHDRKSSEAAYLARVLRLVAQQIQSQQGTKSGSQNVLGTSAAGAPNTVVASFNYTASASNP
ncbi:hypothetical protein SAMN05414138_10211 [Rhodoplanes sp. JGI PP 4-B12]|nr:hypothetical protein SAMN05414138_10211 [Rhodoplanes sp. JGI PP 4-B12]